MADTQAETAKPPYIAFQSLKTLAKTMKEHSVPDQIDRSVLRNFSGAVGSQIITGLKFLGMTDDAGRPQPEMRQLVDAFGTDDWAPRLAGVLKKAYPAIFEINLDAASPQQFNDKFRDTYKIDGDTLRKCITFFLNASQDAQIKVSKYILTNRKPRTAPTKRRSTKGNGETGNGTDRREEIEIEDEKDDAPKPLTYQLIDLLKRPGIGDEEKKAVWTLVQFLSAEA